ncbi:MAG: DUF5675 family protein [Bacteroidota bacterium]
MFNNKNITSIICGLLLWMVPTIHFSQPINTEIGGVVMPPPDVASMGRYIDVPVSYHTGVPNISIPVYTIQDGPIAHSISLSYHAGGVKVAEPASWVGLGWNLNGIGMVSRTTMGLPDDAPTGYFNTGPGITINPSTADRVLVGKGEEDAEPDIFSYSVGGLSGKFFFDKNKVIHYSPKRDVKVIMNDNTAGNIEGFTIITPQGTRYIFGKDGTRTAVQSSSVDAAGDYISAWYLLKIESFDQKHSISFNYSPEKYSYKYPSWCSAFSSIDFGVIGCPPPGTQLGQLYFDCPGAFRKTFVDGVRLNSITNSNGTTTITLNATTNRTDLDAGDGGGNAKRLENIDISSSSYCQRMSFSYSYFSDPSTSQSHGKRLKLNQVQLTNCTGGNVIPPYLFEYYGSNSSLPHRLSKEVDHWGYYNGATQNENLNNDLIIPATQVGTPGSTFTIGGADRESDETNMKYGTLNKITYPTGGSGEFTFEANRIDQTDTVCTQGSTPAVDMENCSTISCSCASSNYDYQTESFTATELQDAQYSFKLESIYFGTGAGSTCVVYSGQEYIAGHIRVKRINSGGSKTQVAFKEFNHTVYTSDPATCCSEVLDDLTSLYSGFQAGVSYEFELYVEDGKGSFEIVTQDCTEQYPRIVGGLRIKQIKLKDNLANKEINRFFSYNKESDPTKSSGLLFNEPKYQFTIPEVGGPGFSETDQVYYSAQPSIPLSDYNGTTVGYTFVQDSTAGNGKSQHAFTFNTTSSSAQHPTPPLMTKYENGQLVKSQNIDASGNIVSKDSIEGYLFNPYVNDAPAYKVYYLPVCPLPSGVERYLVSSAISYSIREGFYIPTKNINILDGVTTETNFTYDATYRHLNPISTSMTNSDNKLTTQNFKYAREMLDANPGNDVWEALIDENRIGIPIEQTTSVGSNQLSGTRTQFRFFNASNGGNPSSTDNGTSPYAHLFERYERTWNSSGVLQSGSWEDIGTVDSIEVSNGFPKAFTRDGWERESYKWDSNNDQIKRRIFKDFTWQYAYHSGTNMVSSITDVDGQVVNYTYDQLMRLKTISARGGNVSTDYTYTYKGGSEPTNSVKTITTFTAVTGSSLTEQGVVQHFDGLGRPIQQSKIGYHPSKGQNGASFGKVDVLVHSEYDNQGRLYKQSLPFASPTNSTNGSYQTPPVNLEYTVTAFEASPLSRVTSVTPPDWYATKTNYGKNLGTVTLPGTSTSYLAGTLYETVVTDPDNRVSKTYKDRKGRLILTERTNTSGTTPAKTYNAYDDKDRLTMIIPPGASAYVTNLIYTYEYSGDNLMLKKRIPGAGTTTMRYNNKDLLTFIQDPNRLAAGESIGTKYDDYGRPTETGFVSGLPSNPDAAFSFTSVLTRNYYDGYDGSNTITAPQYMGKVRRSEARVLDGGSTFLHTTFTYDTHGRVTSTNGNNYLNPSSSTAESMSMTYDWADNVINQDRVHQPGSGATTGNLTTRFRREYDHMGRSKNLYFTINSAGKHLAEYNYDLRDQLIERNLHSNFASGLWAWWQSVDYEYNQLGWLTKINSNSHTGSSQAFPTGCSPGLPSPGSPARVRYPESNDLFYLELRYDQLFSSGASNGDITGMSGTTQKSGNISQLAWRVRGRDRQSYSFTYDYLSRLKTSDYYDVISSGNASGTNRYNEDINYDLRGNITSLERNGYYSSTCNYGKIDDLTYSYSTNSNQLNSISDVASVTQRMHGFDPGSGGAGYTYDANGNLKSDSYKGISSITYNHLNLPDVITYSSGNSIEITYDANGTKLRKTVKVGASTQYQQDYAGGMEYRKTGTGSRRVEAIYHDEGRYFNLNVDVNNTLNWQYEYAIRDHLGNTRLMFTDKNGNNVIDVTNNAVTNDILQENHYYPFGLGFEGPWLMDDAGRESQYHYNGKELNEDFGLNWHDYGARWYDASIGRWNAIDPLAEEMTSWSPYNYTFNNPIKLIDPDGRKAIDATGTPGDYYDSQGNYIGTDGIEDNKIYLVDDGITAENLGLGAGDFLESLLIGNRARYTTEVGGLLILTRTSEGTDYTSGELSMVGQNENGSDMNTLEPGGPETTTANQDKRIPDGVYNVDSYSSERYPNNFILSNNEVSQKRRILIHSGNSPSHTTGCVLPGCTSKIGRVFNSKEAMKYVRQFINENNTSIVDRRDDIKMIIRTKIDNN